MAKYKVTKVFQYTETVYVDAESSSEARDIAGEVEGEVNNDDSYYDCIVEEVDE